MSHIVFLINTLYDLWWGPTGILCGVLRGSCVGSYGDLVCGLTGLLDGSFRVIGWVFQGYWMGLTGLLDGSYRVICWFVFYYLWLWCLEMVCSEIYTDRFIVKHTYQEMSGISIYESYSVFLINTLYDLVVGVIQGFCGGGYTG